MSNRRKAKRFSTWNQNWFRAAKANKGLRASKPHRVEKLEDRCLMTANAVPINNQVFFDRMIDAAFEYASDLSQYSQAEMENATQWVVKTKGGISANNLSLATGMTVTGSSAALSNTFYVHAGNLTASQIQAKLGNNNAIEHFYPTVKADVATMGISNDPLSSLQWHLKNTGQLISNPNEVNNYAAWGWDARVEEAWKKVTGEGVHIVVVDSGFDSQHPDLKGNYDGSHSWNFNQGGIQSPFIDMTGDFHGTAVAGIIAAVGNNGTGVTGIAYNATLSDFRFLGTDVQGLTLDEDDYYQLLTRFSDVADIYNNSWGEANPNRSVSPLTPGFAQGLIDAAFLGRGGLGVIHVFAAGNDAGSGDTGANSGLVNSPYVIAVSGFGPNGSAVTYAEAGPSIFVTAPTGQNPPGVGIITTDVRGNTGYNNANSGLNHDGDWLADLDYTSQMNGTSAATPMVSGVVALMIEAARNNGVELSLRDVQHILARSAYQIDPNDFGGNDIGGWQTNARPLFFDPLEEAGVPVGAQDPTYPGGDNGMNLVSGIAPTIDRQFSLARNGAGFAVHDGINGAGGGSISTAYGHGAIDARMAVELASKWKDNDGFHQAEVGGQLGVQILSAPFSTNNIPAAEVIDVGGTPITIPGGIAGRAGFGEYFDLWLNPPDELPDPLPRNTRGAQSVPITVPANYSVEWVTVNLNMNIDPGASEQIRFTLVSPDGVQSELTNWERTQVNGGLTDTGQLAFTFSTNRHWGERTEGVGTINPITGDRIEPDAIQNGNGVTVAGTWQLVIENWSSSATSVTGSVDFHVTPTPTINNFGNILGGRIQGSIGLDINQDGAFNFNGVHAEEFVAMGANGTPEIVIVDSAALPPPLMSDSFILADYEPTVSGVKVYIDTNMNGQWDSGEQYTYTSADGNYYFDVTWNTNRTAGAIGSSYQVRFELPEGYNVIGDDMQEFIVGIQGDGSIAAYHIESNFILEPAPITFQGNVFADFNLNNQHDLTESTAEGFRLFVDLNENGVLDYNDYNGNGKFDNGIDEALEPMVFTGPDGSYSLEVNTNVNVPEDFFGNVLFFNDFYVGANYYTLMLDAETGWTSTSDDVTAVGFAGTIAGTPSPSVAFKRMYVAPGSVVQNLDFGVVPTTSGPAANGTISGVVFNDANNNGVRQSTEGGLGGFTVFLDIDNNGVLSAGDRSVVTGENGYYLFENVVAGTYTIRVIVGPGFSASDNTKPLAGYYSNVVVGVGASVGKGLLDFGFYNPTAVATAPRDYGDLPSPYGTTGSQAASHGIVPGYHLGAGISAEAAGQPSAGANTDASDDGVEFLSPITAGSLVRVNVTASSNALFLQGWIDFNNDGDFADAGEHIQFRDASGNLLPYGTQLQLHAGVNELSFYAPNSIDASLLAARFRYGEGGNAQLNKPNGAAILGEVEDYMLPANVSTSFVLPLAGDFDGNGTVDQGDYVVWKSSYGSTTDLRADANNDGKVDLGDYTLWRDNLGAQRQTVQTIIAAAPAPLVAAEADGEALPAALVSSVADDPTAPGLVLVSDSGLALFSTASESDGSGPVAAANAVATVQALDLVFDLAEDEDDSNELSFYAENEDIQAEAFCVALEEEFAEMF